MSGAGRKSSYRKGATQYFEQEELDLTETDRIAKILSNRGANIFDVQSSSNEGETIMVKLPSKYHKVVWVKVKDYVVIEECGGSKDEVPLIKYVLNKDHIKYLKKQKRWPIWLQGTDEEIGEAKKKEINSKKQGSYMSDIMPEYVEREEEEEEEEEEEDGVEVVEGEEEVEQINDGEGKQEPEEIR